MKKIALITGGSSGIGKATALRLAENGINSIITYNTSKDEASNVAEAINKIGAKSFAVKLDVSDRQSYMNFAPMVAEILNSNFSTDKFDILINNAGVGLDRRFLEVSEDEFDHLMNIHYRSVYFLSQKLTPLMNENSQILMVSTGTTRIILPGYSLYASLKAAIEALTKFMAKELAPLKIRVNCIAPGATETNFRGGFIRDNKDANASAAAMTTAGRVGLPEDIANAINAIVSDDAHWFNGQRFEASGGQAI